MWKAYRDTEQTYRDLLKEHQELGAGAISFDATRTAEIESGMSTALGLHDACKAGLEAACSALGSNQEPTIRSLTSRSSFLQRQAWAHPEHAGEIAALDTLATTLEGLAMAAGV